jgi:hypothetical protein
LQVYFQGCQPLVDLLVLAAVDSSIFRGMKSCQNSYTYIYHY